MSLDKKQKKQLEVLRSRQTALQQQLAGARRQMDDAEEVRRLAEELADVDKKIATIRQGE